MIQYDTIKKEVLLFLKERIIILTKNLLILLSVCISYYIFHTLTGLGVLCPLNSLTGLLCPLCGVSRMFIALFKLDFKSALYFNGAFLILKKKRKKNSTIVFSKVSVGATINVILASIKTKERISCLSPLFLIFSSLFCIQ